MADEYIHGYSETETWRLTRMQDILNGAELDAAIGAMNRWRTRDAATLWYSLPLAEGVR